MVGLGFLAVTQPEEKSEHAAKGEGAREEPAIRRHSHEAHQEQAQHNHQPDGVPGDVASPIATEGLDFRWSEVVVVRGRWPSTASVDVRTGVH